MMDIFIFLTDGEEMLSHLNTLECSPFIRGSLYGIKPHLRLHLHPGTHPSTPLVTELLRSSE